MNIYEGAVLFVDILGVGALTKAKDDTVTAEDFAAFGARRKENLRNQVFCAVLLTQFRRNLRKYKSSELRIAQLSDCAFIWSKDVDAVVEFARKLFWENLNTGLLCRAGMTFGEIVEPEKIGQKIGDFVCGEAVTRAVELEETGKGSRIFIDRHIGGKILRNTPADVFVPVTSAIDYRLADEYAWFALPPSGDVAYRTPPEHIMSIIDASLRLRFKPQFRWNAESPQGRIHVGATIDRLQTFAISHCKRHGLPFPQFPFLSCETYMEMGRFSNGDERNERTFVGMTKMVNDYKRRVFKKKRRKISTS